jgi:heme-degrading monooxygenase HmoA
VPDRAVRQDPVVITEHAALGVKSGQERAFEQAFDRAKAIIASMPGFVALSLDRCVEVPGRYLLLVEWERLEDHTHSFRRSPEYDEWRALLHHFYDPFPTVHHDRRVTEIR